MNVIQLHRQPSLPKRCTDCMVGQGTACHCRKPMSSRDGWMLLFVLIGPWLVGCAALWLWAQ